MEFYMGVYTSQLNQASFQSVTCGFEPPPAHSAGPEPLWAPPDSAGSWDPLSLTSPGEKPGLTARWFDPAAAGWTYTGSHHLPPVATKSNPEQQVNYRLWMEVHLRGLKQQ